MADEDNFDIDIYGDGEGMDEDSKAFYKQEMEKDLALRETKKEEAKADKAAKEEQSTKALSEVRPSSLKEETKREPSEDVKPKMPQGTKRKGESDERRIDAGATNALMISDLHWWTTEDDIRGWINDAGSEDELKDITFSEHKVNGKSKGQVYLEFTSPQASTATKHKIEKVSTGPTSSSRKFSVAFHNASSNPFKTLPKDAPARPKDDRPQRAGSTPYSASTHNDYNSSRGGSSYRGRGSYHMNNTRGSYNQNGYNNNRNFSGPPAVNTGGFSSNNFGGGANMGMNNFGNNFNPRGGGGVGGGMMNNNNNNNNFRGGGGMRGRGGGGGNMMPMNMGMMGGPMTMNPMMMAGMAPQGFGGNPQFNMFNQGGQGMNGGDWGSNKRPRHE